MKQILKSFKHQQMYKILFTISLITAIGLITQAQVNFPVKAGSKTLFAAHTPYTNNLQLIVLGNFRNDSSIRVKDYAYYMQKSKNHRTTGLVLLGAGVLASGIGLLLATNPNSYDQSETAAVCFVIGFITGVTSIPFMATALGYRNKAKLMISTQKTGYGFPRKYGKDLTGLTLSIPIKR
jgi:hypothetical protein